MDTGTRDQDPAPQRGGDARRLTLAEAARVSGHAAVSLRQAVRLGRLRAERVGEGNRSTLYVTASDLQEYLGERRTWRSYGQTGTPEQRAASEA